LLKHAYGIIMVTNTVTSTISPMMKNESHCVLKSCSKHAEEFKLIQKGGPLETPGETVPVETVPDDVEGLVFNSIIIIM
jgi:hypothetical protein